MEPSEFPTKRYLSDMSIEATAPLDRCLANVRSIRIVDMSLGRTHVRIDLIDDSSPCLLDESSEIIGVVFLLMC